MAQNVTYRQIVDEFQSACTAHLQIASFDSGTIDYLDASAANRRYPLVFLRPLASVVIDRVKTTSIELYSLDVPKVSAGSNIDVVSNTEIYIYDLMAWFDFGPATRSQSWGVTMTNNAPVNEAFQDRVFGWVANIDVTTPFNLDYCNYPQV